MRLLFFSSHHGTGASESLWLETAVLLAQQGHAVAAMATWTAPWRERARPLLAAGIPFTPLLQPTAVAKGNLLAKRLGWARQRFLAELRRYRPDAIHFSQGNDISALPWMELAAARSIPFVIVSHGVIPWEWPDDPLAARLQAAFGNARHSFWVAERNRTDFEFHLGERLPRSSVAWNPVRWDRAVTVPWPTGEGPSFRLACVARLQARPKGHDLLLQALARPDWENRDWRLTFYGDGPNLEGMKRLTQLLGIAEKVRFAGHVSNLTEIWAGEHWIAQPSRNEGMPLSLIEAMMAGRPAIATDVAGHGEIIDDGESGFLAPSPSVAGLCQALDRAWAHRHQAQLMGRTAAQRIRDRIPENPVATYAAEVIDVLSAS